MILNLDLLDSYNEDIMVADYYLCTVKWFCKKKNYGFVFPGFVLDEKRAYIDVSSNTEIPNPEEFFNALKQEVKEPIESEIFIHSSRGGSTQLPIKTGDILSCKIVKSARGLQTDEIYQYFSMQKSTKEITVCNATVKWFNKQNDFGFLKADSREITGKADIFLSGKRVREMGINPDNLTPNRRVLCSFALEDGKAVAIKVELL